MDDKTVEQSAGEDLVCFSHLRWGFVFQRPQHLMSRFARRRRVFFVEEALYEDRDQPEMRRHACEQSGVVVVTPVLPREAISHDPSKIVSKLLRRFFLTERIETFIAWYYTPMALDFTADLRPTTVIYDCMDELSLFRNAPPALGRNELTLFKMAHLVFTGGVSLFEAKQQQYPRVYPFPSSVDCNHFAKSRTLGDLAPDQQHLPRPRLGYAGVIDERIDLSLICAIAERRPDWQLIMIGPIVKVDPASLPQLPNIHWLGMKKYDELPEYFAGWDAGLMPFALNDATRFISPTKTPEYLAAGLPVVSTAIRDVVRQYERLGLVRIGRTIDEFVAAIEGALTYHSGLKVRERADEFLKTLSWDRTWSEMNRLLEEARAIPLPAQLAFAASSSQSAAA